MFSFFTLWQNSLLILTAAFTVASLFLHFKNRHRISVLLLTLAAVCVYAFAALLDPFLNIWDERFHALVAKNLMHHPLLPTLYDQPLVDMVYDRWDRAFVWLHKQPLFLWQIAGSFKLFGVSEFALRLPSVIMASLMVPVTYRIGKLLVNESVGYYSSLLVFSSFYTIQLVSGRQGMEHNDMAFLFYVSASIWAWIEYVRSDDMVKWKWAIAIGIFSGGAILCKWLVGLLVYATWGVAWLLEKDNKKAELIRLILSLTITVLIVLPWQLLSFTWYPAEAAFELKYNTLHFSQALEGHGGDLLYHWNNMPKLFGQFVPYLIFPSLALLVFLARKQITALAFVLLPLIVYLFYSLASTKMETYPYVVAMPIYVALSTLIFSLVSILKPYLSERSYRIGGISLLFILVLTNLDLAAIAEKHTHWKGHNEYVSNLSANRATFLELKNELPSNTVLFNVSGRHYVEAMFYTGFPAYQMMPPESVIRDLRERGYRPIIINDGRVEIPMEIQENEAVTIIERTINSYD